MPRSLKLSQKGKEAVEKAMEEKGFSTQGDLAAHNEVALSTVNNFVRGIEVSTSKAKDLLATLGLSSDDESLFNTSNIQLGEHWGVVNSGIGTTQVQNFILPREISNTPVDDVQGNAANQISILASYYSEGLTQAKASFRSALIISGIGFFFFLTAVVFVLNRQPRDRTLIPLVSGAIIEVVAGINFYLYGQATKQLATFQSKLNQMQRFLLANSICESLEGDSKQAARTKLVETVSSLIE